MKKLLSVIMLVCIVASMCTVSAWADGNYGAQWIEAYKSGTPGTSDYREAFTCSLYIDGGQDFIVNNSLTVEWYSGSTLLCRSTLNSSLIPYTGKPSLTADAGISCNAVIYGKPSSSWSTEWFVPMNNSTLPDHVVALIDGTIRFEGGTIIQATPGIYDSLTAPDMPIVRLNSNNTVAGYYNTLDEAVEAAPAGSKSYISIRAEGTYSLSDAQGKDITFISNASNVTIDNDPNGNYSNSTFENIPVTNLPAPVNPDPGVNPNPAPVTPAAPVVEDIYYIPATDDNSNMALWSILALALLSTAFVTRKRKNEN